jgi:hypothetical protein
MPGAAPPLPALLAAEPDDAPLSAEVPLVDDASVLAPVPPTKPPPLPSRPSSMSSRSAHPVAQALVSIAADVAARSRTGRSERANAAARITDCFDGRVRSCVALRERSPRHRAQR